MGHDVEDINKRIKKEQMRLRKIFSSLDENKKKIVEPLIQNVAFMAVTMADLQTSINANGVALDFVDRKGNESQKQSVEASTYINMQKNYLLAVKYLLAMCPAAKNKASKLEMLRNGA
jgi:hypothetical protein